MVDSADLPPEYRGGAARGASGGASAAEVEKDAAQGSEQIKKWEEMRKSTAPAAPFGGLAPGEYKFGTPAMPLGGKTSSGDSSINAPVTNTFNIDGANDPSIVAHAVAANQDRVVSDMARNLVGAHQ